MGLSGVATATCGSLTGGGGGGGGGLWDLLIGGGGGGGGGGAAGGAEVPTPLLLAGDAFFGTEFVDVGNVGECRLLPEAADNGEAQ